MIARNVQLTQGSDFNREHTDPLAAEIFTLGKDAAWIRELPEDSDEGIQWEQRRAAVVRAAARRIC